MSGPSSLSIRGVTKAYGATPVLSGIDLEARPGEVVVLLGPSGCGKTTLLRLIGGLDPLDGGEVRADDVVLSSVAVSVPTEQRRMGMVFQDGALFPHMSVARNVGFGLERSSRRAGHRIDEMLELVGLGGLGHRAPESLSGGERQRVALARALAPAPGVLLMDEPFSNLDAVLRQRLRRDVRNLLRSTGVTTLFVTHDRDEAFSLADRVAVMSGGRLEQVGRPHELYRRPHTKWLASFVGEASFLRGSIGTGSPAEAADVVVAATAIGDVEVARVAPTSGRCGTVHGELVDILVRPEDLVLTEGGSDTGETGIVEDVEYLGGYSMVSVRIGTAPAVTVRTATVAGRSTERGDRVGVGWAPGRGVPAAFPAV